MKYWVVAAILLFNFIVQSAILPFLRIAGIQPDTLMVLVTCFGRGLERPALHGDRFPDRAFI
jgi:hypothetical protein